jgi:nucleoside-diphosphate-sugar epimerase
MILVTGATGVAGELIVAELLRRGHAVRALCRPSSAAAARLEGAEIALGDLRDPDSLARAARGARGIVHAAATFTDPAADIAATAALLDAWEAGPFVFLSTLDVYGLAGPGVITEDTPTTEAYDEYSRGKVICERQLFEAAGRAARGGHVSLRAPYIWGPHPTARERLVVRRLLEDQPIVLPGADEADWRRFQDVWIDTRDLAIIVAECVARPASGPLNVLTGHFTWHDLYVELIRWTGSRSRIVHKPLDAIRDEELPRKHLYAQTWRFSEARLAQHLGAIPRRSLEVTVRDTVAVTSRRAA